MPKSPRERLYQFLIDKDIMMQGMIEAKKKLNIPHGELELSKNHPIEQ